MVATTTGGATIVIEAMVAIEVMVAIDAEMIEETTVFLRVIRMDEVETASGETARAAAAKCEMTEDHIAITAEEIGVATGNRVVVAITRHALVRQRVKADTLTITRVEAVATPTETTMAPRVGLESVATPDIEAPTRETRVTLKLAKGIAAHTHVAITPIGIIAKVTPATRILAAGTISIPTEASMKAVVTPTLAGRADIHTEVVDTPAKRKAQAM